MPFCPPSSQNIRHEGERDASLELLPYGGRGLERASSFPGGLAAVLTDVLPPLRSAEKPLVLKAFPECLPRLRSGSCRQRLSLRPSSRRLLGDPGEKRVRRLRLQGCVQGEKCWGLSRAYIARFGDEREHLSPILMRPDIDETRRDDGHEEQRSHERNEGLAGIHDRGRYFFQLCPVALQTGRPLRR